jgi:hypothetical protein
MKRSSIIDAEVESAMIATVSHWLYLARDLLSSESSQKFIRHKLRAMVREGTASALMIIAWARAGVPDADEILRAEIAQALDHGQPLSATLACYAATSLLSSPPPANARAVVAADHLLRDMVIACMVGVCCSEWPFLRATRNRASQAPPSACSIVAKALLRHHIALSERRIEGIFRLYGDLLVQHKAALLSRPRFDEGS